MRLFAAVMATVLGLCGFASDRVAYAQRTVADVVQQVGEGARARLIPYFQGASVSYPPQRITLLAIKDVARLELWTGRAHARTFIRAYPIQALSGISGPKLREGDFQVPEGVYAISGLNPNSSYHLSMKLNYPNPFDLAHARREGRTSPGSNIFIHGKAVSIGCLALGDEAIEELFVLIADTGRTRVKVVIAPSDPRSQLLVAPESPTWQSDLYEQISNEFASYVHQQ